MWTPDVCFYHDPCDDGFASAWVVRRKWPTCQLVGVNYGLAVPDVDLAGKNLLIADFSYKPEVLERLSEKARTIVILDHHKTAQVDLETFAVFNPVDCETIDAIVSATQPGLGNVRAVFNMAKSGAALTWEFCNPGEPLPYFVRLIEDRDLWRFAYAETREFSLYLRSFPRTFDDWDAVADRLTHNPELALGEAKGIQRFYDAKLAELVPTAVIGAIGKWKGVPIAHAPYAFASDLAHELLEAHPSAPFAAVVVNAYGGTTYSLRSTDARQDVSEVARTFGGGGHRNAAGFRMP